MRVEVQEPSRWRQAHLGRSLAARVRRVVVRAPSGAPVDSFDVLDGVPWLADVTSARVRRLRRKVAERLRGFSK